MDKHTYRGNALSAMYGLAAVDWAKMLVRSQMPKLEVSSPEIYQMHKTTEMVLTIIEEEEIKKVYENLKGYFNQW